MVLDQDRQNKVPFDRRRPVRTLLSTTLRRTILQPIVLKGLASHVGEAVTKNWLHLRILTVALVVASSLFGQTVGTRDALVTAVEGESWISHIQKPFNETSMGRSSWKLGPTPEETYSWQMRLSPGYATQLITLHGSDLYRLSCQGCHGELGHGAPPEINSIPGPVQATSVAATTERMKKAGRELSRSDVAVLAKESKGLLLQRLHVGGEHMLPPTLSEAEIRSLVPYLEQLSDVPGAEKNQVAVKESSNRVGEHIVKSTCHICHSATGPNPSPEQILEGAIPPLSTLTTRVNLPDFVRKVTSGAPIIMGEPPASHRGKMPVFIYLSQDEASAVYGYLILYPPQP
jgi:mono/diheme cytochrome c family protein